MSFAGLGLVEAMHAGPKPVKRGQFSHSTELHGVPVEVTYNVEGRFFRGTREMPDEYPAITLVTLTVAGVELDTVGPDADFWLDCTELMAAIEDEVYA